MKPTQWSSQLKVLQENGVPSTVRDYSYNIANDKKPIVTPVEKQDHELAL